MGKGKLIVTHEQLRLIAPNLTVQRAKLITSALNFCIVDFKGMHNIDVLEEFIAQLCHESGGFRIREESGNYRAERLLQVFPKYFKSLAQARPYAGNPQALFNFVYANRMGNGAPSSGDGFRYRGGGFIQLTGKSMYSKYATYIKKSVEETARLVREDDYFAMHSACWFFSIEAKLIPASIADDFMTVTRRINGGTNGMADRLKYYERAKRVLNG